ncbi:MAG TPA: hypothetical protein VEX39_07150 [Thermoleophilaceae bacterium]|nr:hypothetical protein [Thermoleophilaceae bacterium]
MRAPRLLLSLLFIAVALAVAAQPAAAQCRNVYKYVPYPPYGDLVLECGPTTPQKKAKPKPTAKPPTRAQLRALRYKPSARVTRKVREDLVRRLATGPQAAAIAADIRAGNLLRQTNRPLRKARWSTSDLGDRYAQAFIGIWLVVNDKKTTSKAVDRAVRKQLKAQLARGKWRRCSDARQQEYAERLSSWLVVIAGKRNGYRQAGLETQADLWRYDANKVARSSYLFGQNMFSVKLTRRGVVDD